MKFLAQKCEGHTGCFHFTILCIAKSFSLLLHIQKYKFYTLGSSLVLICRRLFILLCCLLCQWFG